MRKALTVVVLLAGCAVFSWFQFRPAAPPPAAPNPSPEKLVALDPASPPDALLETYLDAVHSTGQLEPRKDTVAQLLARFDGRTPYLAAVALEPIAASRAFVQSAQKHEELLRKKFGPDLNGQPVTSALLDPVLGGAILPPGLPDAPGDLLLLDVTAGKPDVLKKIEREGEVLYRLRWHQGRRDIVESLVLVRDEGAWKVLTPGLVPYAWKSIAPDPSTGEGRESGLFREDKDWTAADLRKSNAELARRIRDRQTALDELTRQLDAGMITTIGEYRAAYEKWLHRTK